MDTLSHPRKCGAKLAGICVYIKDKGDLRFKICKYCGHVEYRTDEEVMEGKP